MKKKTLLFSALVALFTIAFNNKSSAEDYFGTPYGGVASVIPGTIEAENYDDGGEFVAYHDSDAVNHGGAFRTEESVDIESTTDESGDYNTGWCAAEEWIKYSVDVTEAGDYNIAIRYGTEIGGKIKISFVSGVDTVTVKTDAPANGPWTVWDWLNVPVKLKAGPQVMILYPGANINYFTFSKVVTGLDLQKSALVNIYQNPVTNHLKLSVVADKILIADLSGKIIITQENSNEVDLTNLSSGMYFVKIGLNGQLVTKKIIKK